MRFLLLSCMFVIAVLEAQTLDELIDRGLHTATSLAMVEKRIEIKQQDVATADLFANPILAITKNTLPSNQAMSQATVTVGQKLYWWGKRDEKEAVAKGEVEI